jgi:hypothetical protein
MLSSNQRRSKLSVAIALSLGLASLSAATGCKPKTASGNGSPAASGSAASMWVSEMPEDPVGWLSGLGWDAEAFTLRDRAAAYGRPISTPPQRDEGPGGLISAVRR